MKKKSTNCKKQSMGIVIVAAMMLLLLAGTILAPTQASALSKFNTNTDTSSLKHVIRDGVSVNLEHRDQHMNQENLCYRTNTCRQSSVGQNTLGNDNSITGFADQSDNLQQSTTANKTTPTTTTTPANQTTGNSTTPTPTPRTCIECFTSILTPTQLSKLLSPPITREPLTLEQVCAEFERFPNIPVQELLSPLTQAGVPLDIQLQLIQCLIKAGIHFTS
jgi:hypothetical protein